MNTLFVISIFLLFASITFAAAPTSFIIPVIPQPASFTPGPYKGSCIDSEFQIETSKNSKLNHNNPLFQSMIMNFKAKLFTLPKEHFSPCPSTKIVKIIVQVDSADTTLQYGIDESYTLFANETLATLTSQTVYGMVHGLDTFSQLVEPYVAGDRPSISMKAPLPGTQNNFLVPYVPILIKDSPRFAWRGILLDTARHYYSVDDVLHIIDGMSLNKLNVLHWHLLDAQSFAYDSESLPQLSKKGSFCPECSFNRKDIELIVAYAQQRAIRILPEIDVPGHSYGFGFAFPDMVADCPSDYAGNINNFPLNLASNTTYSVLTTLLKEFSTLFPDDFIHLGGDEVVPQCWNNPQMLQWMKEKGFTSFNQAEQYFITWVQQQAQVARPRRVITWQDVFDSGFKQQPDSLVQSWRDDGLGPAGTLHKTLNLGIDSIWSSGLYLDRQIPDESLTFYGWIDTYQDFYIEPFVAIGTLSPEAKKHLIGFEAAMWSEQVSHQSWDTRVWPRATAAAERGWSPESTNDIGNLSARLIIFVCRMQRLGFGASPIYPAFCRHSFPQV